MDSLITIRGLKTRFFLDEGTVRAVDGVDLDIPKGRTIGVVGESGCGKSVMAFSILRLVSNPGRIVAGSIALHREEGDLDLTGLDEDGPEIRDLRGREIAMIFQEPMTSLSPVHTVGSQIMEAILLHTDLSKAEARAHTVEMMEWVGIPDSERRFKAFPHQLSGGLRQRIMIAMALSCRPALLIADEPTTALDVTIQAQILDLMSKLQEKMGTSILLITHDLGVVAQMADEIAVMYLGRVVEQGEAGAVFAEPAHPYTQALMRSIPSRPAGRRIKLEVIEGSVPDPFARISGCPFHPRCREALQGTCDSGGPPSLMEIRPGHKTACLLRQPEAEADHG